MQASGPRELKESFEQRDDELDVFPGLTEIRLRRQQIRERIAARRPRRRPRAAPRALLTAGALGLLLLAAWQALSPPGEGASKAGPRSHPSQPVVLSSPPSLAGTALPFTVRVEAGTPSVELSPALRRAVRREWPGYRLRPAAAIRTEALEELRQEHPEVQSPYAVIGDYNGDDRADAALLLKNGDRALLVALHATPKGRFEGHVLERGPWSDGLYLLSQPPGVIEYTVTRDQESAAAATLSLPGDAVRFHPVHAGARVYYWQEGRYRRVDAGE